MRQHVRNLVLAVVGGAAALTLTLGGVQTAQASGVILGVFGTACLPGGGLCWPGGTLSVSVSGSGKKIAGQSADVQDLIGSRGSGAVLCNWHIDFSDHNSKGKDTYRSDGAVHKGCTGARISRNVSKGRTASSSAVQTCSELWSQGAQVHRTCINLG
ncbi:hypothetical protein [Curtobacterium sp. 1544]|jgi:hypothetical protein|uniref:hypothetical protein n=1 Tax=Curtobacterium sp. 1544 TaxID=3156417 RepID=UPI003398BF69